MDYHSDLKRHFRQFQLNLLNRCDLLAEKWKQERNCQNKEWLVEKIKLLHKLYDQTEKKMIPLLISLEGEYNYLRAVKKEVSRSLIQYKTKAEKFLSYYEDQLESIDPRIEKV